MRIQGLKSPSSRIAFGLFFILASAAFCFSACSINKQNPIRIATNQWPGYEPLYLADSKNLYKDTEAKLFRMPSASAVITAYRNKKVDVAALTLDEALLLLQDGIDAKIILIVDSSNGGDAVLGHSDISSMKELKGRKVGVESSALGAFMLSRALEKSGMKPKDITPVSITVDGHARAFLERRVDAVVTFEPVRSELIKKGARVLFDSKKIPDEIFDVLVARPEIIKERKSDISNVLNGWFAAQDFIKRNPDEAMTSMAKLENISTDQFSDSLRLLKIPGKKENLALLSGKQPGILAPTKKLANAMLKEKLLSRKVDIGKLLPEKVLIK